MGDEGSIHNGRSRDAQYQLPLDTVQWGLSSFGLGAPNYRVAPTHGYKDQVSLYANVGNSSLDGAEPRRSRSKFDYQLLIIGARRLGYDFAADNLEYFLSGKGGTRRIDRDYILQYREIQRAYDVNMTRIEENVESIAGRLKPGETATYDDYWEVDIVPETRDLAYASGSSTFTSRTFISIEKHDNGRAVASGVVSHEWTDRYDWDDGKSFMIPLMGEFKDEDAKALQETDGAAPFNLESIWIERY